MRLNKLLMENTQAELKSQLINLHQKLVALFKTCISTLEKILVESLKYVEAYIKLVHLFLLLLVPTTTVAPTVQ